MTRSKASKSVIKGHLFRERGANGKVQFVEELPTPERQPASIARRLAFAHKLRTEIENETYTDQADVARSFDTTRNRVTQLMWLLNLAPDIQEEIFGLEAVDGREPVYAKQVVKQVAKHRLWTKQREAWSRLYSGTE